MPLKTASEDFSKYKNYVNKAFIGRVAVKLARNTFFGVPVLEASSLNGTNDSAPLDPNVLMAMKSVIREKFMDISPTEFEGV